MIIASPRLERGEGRPPARIKGALIHDALGALAMHAELSAAGQPLQGHQPATLAAGEQLAPPARQKARRFLLAGFGRIACGKTSPSLLLVEAGR